MIIGLVKWFDIDRGYGVVATPENEEYFLHINSFLIKPVELSKGNAIIFATKIDKTKNRISAVNSRLVGKLGDWKLIFSYLGKYDKVRIELNIKNKKEVITFSLLHLAAQQYFIDKSEQEIIKTIIDYFDTHLDAANFISYCEQFEYRIIKDFPDEISTRMLDNIFSYFRDKLNESVLFEVWKHKKFKYILYNDNNDYEISESILTSRISEINIHELSRIQDFSFGSDYCSKYLNIKFSNTEFLTSSDIKELYKLLDFENVHKKEERKSFIDKLYATKIKTELIEKAHNLEKISNHFELNKFTKLVNLIPYELNDEIKNQIKNDLNQILKLKVSDEFKPELWSEGIIDEVSFDMSSKYFCDKNTPSEKQINILSLLKVEQQIELLKLYSIQNGIENSFAVIEALVKKENLLSQYFKITDVAYNIEFWANKKCNLLFDFFVKYINENTNDEQKFELFLKGYIKDVPLQIVYQNIEKLEKLDYRIIFINIAENKKTISSILNQKISQGNISDLNWLYDLAKEFLDNESFNTFDKNVYANIDQTEFFKLWKDGKTKTFPQDKIGEILNENFVNYEEITSWIQIGATTSSVICDFMLSYLTSYEPVSDRRVFQKQFNHIKYLLGQSTLYIGKIRKLQNEFYNLILWFFNEDHILDFEVLKQKFIYFSPTEQVRIIRKLFFLKENGLFDLTVEKLDELTRFDLDLYKTNLIFNPDISVDISTDVVIKALLSYNKGNRFFVESELLTIILNDLRLDKTWRFKLSNYFENCLGRLTAEFDWDTNGTIKKITAKNQDGVDVTYFAIEFEYNQDLLERVKSLPGRRWNQSKGHWGVPLHYEKQVMEFAKEHRFFLDFEGSNTSNNIHLSEFKREIIPPIGISFCEGRLANRVDDIFKREFWWCGGRPCFGKCETIHPKEEWENYTLLDFCEILDFNTDEINEMGDHISKGKYYQFIALINRFNLLLDKLYCHDCEHILYPSDFGTGHFAAHTMVKFQCRNESCSNNDEIYLNHCLNGQCNCIIDSRVSKRCDNGLFICDNCGSCCSHKMMERRLSNLKLTGGYVHENLIKSVNEKAGHLEKAEYFCYKCKSEMLEVRSDLFQCYKCNVKYDTAQYKFNRPHKHLKKKKKSVGDEFDNNNI